MAELQFSTGLVTYDLNGKCQVTFNPTDSAFVQRLFDAFNALDEKQEAYRLELEAADEKGEVFAIARKRDGEMRRLIDGLFDAPVCEALFGPMNVYAMADGLPVWANLLLAVIDEVDAGFNGEKKKTDPRIARYTAKYHR